MILVIGLGNPLRGDDGIGNFVVGAIKNCFPQGKTPSGQVIMAIARHDPSPELTDIISHAEKVIFVTTKQNVLTGQISCCSIAKSALPRPYTHDLTLPALLQSVRILHGHSPKTILVSMTSSHFDDGQSLSLQAVAALPALVSLVFRLFEDNCFSDSDNLIFQQTVLKR